MSDTGVDFTDVQWTQLVTLYLRALDACSEAPILGDAEAAAALDRIDYDFDSPWMRSVRGDRVMIALRARALDDRASAYLERHPGATVVQLGCGLDSRAFRLRRPSGSRWFDIDLPDVIALRRRLYVDDRTYRMIGCSVTEPAWLDEIPTDGPVLVIAEGLLMYLDPRDVVTLLHRVAGRFPSGRLLADGLAPWVVGITRCLPGQWRAFAMRWPTRGATDVSRLDAAYRAVATIPVFALSAQIPHRGWRWFYRALGAVPGLRRTMVLTVSDFGG